MQLQGVWTTWNGYCNLNSGPLQEHQALLTAEPSLHPNAMFNETEFLKDENEQPLKSQNPNVDHEVFQ